MDFFDKFDTFRNRVARLCGVKQLMGRWDLTWQCQCIGDFVVFFDVTNDLCRWRCYEEAIIYGKYTIIGNIK